MRSSCWAVGAGSLALCTTALFGPEIAGCSSNPPSGDSVSAVTDAGADAPPVTRFTEKVLALDLVLTLTEAGPSLEAGAEVVPDAAAGALDAGPAPPPRR